LAYLPEIMRDGITQGEVPIGPIPYAGRPQAANLTTNPKRKDQQLWNDSNSTIDKTRIRLTVDIPESELTSFREVKERYKIRASWLKLVAPYHVRPQWYYAFGGVRPDQIKLVEKWDNGEYVVVCDLKGLIEKIETELDRAVVFRVATSGIAKGAREWHLKPGVQSTWLFDRMALCRAEQSTVAEIARADFIVCYCEETDEEYALWGRDLAERTRQRFARNQPPEKKERVVTHYTVRSIDGMDRLHRLIREVKDHISAN